MKSISILGCGWLGMPLGKALANGYDVKGSTTSESKLEEIGRHGMKPFLIKMEASSESKSDFFESDILITTIPPSNTEQSESYFDQLQEILRLSKNHIKHILFISSSSVYPNLNRKVTEEDASYEALTRSGISLLKAEDMLRTAENTIVRFSGLIGGRRHPGRWFAGKENLRGAKLPVNMIHLEDCIGIIQTIIENDHWGRTFNACYPEHPAKRDYYKKLASDSGMTAPKYGVEESVSWKTVSSDFLISETGYEFKRSIWEV